MAVNYRNKYILVPCISGVTRLILFLFVSILFSCQLDSEENENAASDEIHESTSEGKLFIIGGGKRTEGLIKSMIEFGEVQREDTILVLSWASSEPDTSFFYINRQIESYCDNIIHVTDSTLDKQHFFDASLIYITGGDQNRFMNSVAGTNVKEWIYNSFEKGCCIAGTSAGAALMSEVMISGDQKMSEEYKPTYEYIVAENAIYNEGLGLLKGAIIDQHFIARSRHNRLLTAAYDHPELVGFGIDESTALCVEEGLVFVSGEYQVAVFQPEYSRANESGRIGLRDLKLDILLPGDSMKISGLF